MAADSATMDALLLEVQQQKVVIEAQQKCINQLRANGAEHLRFKTALEDEVDLLNKLIKESTKESSKWARSIRQLQEALRANRASEALALVEALVDTM
jgi:hypothetical protein